MPVTGALRLTLAILGAIVTLSERAIAQEDDFHKISLDDLDDLEDLDSIVKNEFKVLPQPGYPTFDINESAKYGIDIAFEPGKDAVFREKVNIVTPDNQRLACYLPNTQGKAEEKLDPALFRDPFDLMDDVMEKSCARKSQSAWSYQVCFGKNIRQTFEKRLPDGSVGVELEYWLGNYKEGHDGDSEENWTNPDKEVPTLEWEGRTYPYYSQAYNGGTVCDLTGQPRVSTLRYICDPTDSTPAEIVEIVETSVCVYRFTIATPLLCQDPRFQRSRAESFDIVCTSEEPNEKEHDDAILGTHGAWVGLLKEKIKHFNNWGRPADLPDDKAKGTVTGTGRITIKLGGVRDEPLHIEARYAGAKVVGKPKSELNQGPGNANPAGPAAARSVASVEEDPASADGSGDEAGPDGQRGDGAADGDYHGHGRGHHAHAGHGSGGGHSAHAGHHGNAGGHPAHAGQHDNGGEAPREVGVAEGEPGGEGRFQERPLSILEPATFTPYFPNSDQVRPPPKRGCIAARNGEWRYEFCVDDYVVQGRENHPSVLVLGEWREKAHHEWYATMSADKRKVAVGSNYVSLLYSSGDFCDVARISRNVVVKIVCDASATASPDELISFVEETSTCRYAMLFKSKKLCPLVAELKQRFGYDR